TGAPPGKAYWPLSATEQLTAKLRRTGSSDDSDLQRLTDYRYAEGHQTTRQDPQKNDQQAVHSHQTIGEYAVVQRAHLAFRLVKIGDFHYTEVVESTDQRHHHSEHGQPDMTSANHCLQHCKLGVEAGQRRNPCQRE